jgi:hypothetical protein
MLYELTKSEKKVAQAAIAKGTENAFKEAMENFEAIVKEWQQGKFTSHKEAYHKLYRAVDRKDSAIGRRYDGVTGGRYLQTVVGILQDGHITEADIEGFSEQTKEMIKIWGKGF